MQWEKASSWEVGDWEFVGAPVFDEPPAAVVDGPLCVAVGVSCAT
jgi:hypothetical protein